MFFYHPSPILTCGDSIGSVGSNTIRVGSDERDDVGLDTSESNISQDSV